MSKKNTDAPSKPSLRVINGGINAKSDGLGDPCVPIDISYIPQQSSKPEAPLHEVDRLED